MFIRTQFTKGQDLLHTILAKFTRRRKVRGIRQIRFDKGTLDDLFTRFHGLEDLFGKEVAGVRHGESGTAGAGLGLDDFVATKLGTDRQGFEFGVRGGESVDLAKEGEDGDTGVAANDRHVHFGGVLAEVAADESIGANDVEGGDTAEFGGVVNALLFENFGGDGDGRVDGVADNGQDGVGAEFGAAFDEGLDNRGVGLLFVLESSVRE